MAVKCWKDYREKVTKRLLQKLGAFAWLLAILILVPTIAMIIVGADQTVLGGWLAIGSILVMELFVRHCIFLHHGVPRSKEAKAKPN